ncbi:hypothetical protein RIF29_23168 [Crotalaria pallida]|uniref:Carbohydrate kinase PfkB domain-containing protein n=1 Tax=Crotalaria pallida TaxID=3830 RepID=A0AAN9F7F4_CROPI
MGLIERKIEKLTRVALEEVEYILRKVNIHVHSSPDNDPSPIKTMAGGSVANTIRGLSSGFGISSGIIGACGDGEQGELFVHSMNSNGVDLSRLKKKVGHTAQCVCLVDAFGNRTMRPCLSSAANVQAEELTKEDFKGSKPDVVLVQPHHYDPDPHRNCRLMQLQ